MSRYPEQSSVVVANWESIWMPITEGEDNGCSIHCDVQGGVCGAAGIVRNLAGETRCAIHGGKAIKDALISPQTKRTGKTVSELLELLHGLFVLGKGNHVCYIDGLPVSKAEVLGDSVLLKADDNV